MLKQNRFPQIIASLDQRVEGALRVGAELVEQAAKERVPVDSGKLRGAIHKEKHAGGWSVVAGNADVFYGHIVEHGGAHTGPRPFLVPALEQSRGEILGLVNGALRRL